jgi:hypothetical protein
MPTAHAARAAEATLAAMLADLSENYMDPGPAACPRTVVPPSKRNRQYMAC